MDLTPFFQNVERIATALETIARNTQKPVINNVSNVTQFDVEELIATLRPQPLPPFDQLVLDRAMDLDADVLFPSPAPEPAAPADDAPVVFMPLDTVIKEIFDGGTTTAYGIANKLNEMGRVTEKGRRFNNVNVKPLMTSLGLQSSHTYKGGRGNPVAKDEPVKEAATEPDPEPVVTRKPVVPGVNNFKQSKQIAAAVPDTPVADLIAQAIADGKVTYCPAFIDSDGYNHFEGNRLNKPKVGFAGTGVHRRGARYTNRKRA
jgi:hypothetical protein